VTLSRKQIALIGAVFGVVYAVSSVLRGNVLPGLVAAALGAVLVFLTVTRLQERHQAARRRREREDE
jgi:L-lactate permease